VASREERKRYYEKKYKIINTAKEVPCLDCGNNFPVYVMEFDHIGPKKKTVSSMAGRDSIKVLLEEMKQCEIVCANCHKIRTYKRRISEGNSEAESPVWNRNVGIS
jgi:5-methylcytosine-specific restriction endonuclease McrA